MTSSEKRRVVGILVGSSQSQICSIGAFARRQYESLRAHNVDCFFDAPQDFAATYPNYPSRQDATAIMLHMPSLFERRSPWHFLISLFRAIYYYPFARLFIELHEYTEAPWHWKLRVRIVSLFATAFIVNTKSDQLALCRFSKNVIRSHLGPTLWLDNKHITDDNSLRSQILQSRQAIASRLSIPAESELIVLPGLLTPGKGIEFFLNWAESNTVKLTNAKLVLMGGLGPKSRDHNYVETIKLWIDALNKRGVDTRLLLAQTDAEYTEILLAANLVVLPFKEGVSERRSTFLSACSCAANVWTIAGRYSDELELTSSGVRSIHNSVTDSEKYLSLTEAYEASKELTSDDLIKRRLSNINWSKAKSWDSRNKQLLSAILQIK
jgi:hypothetical protein